MTLQSQATFFLEIWKARIERGTMDAFDMSDIQEAIDLVRRQAAQLVKIGKLGDQWLELGMHISNDNSIAKAAGLMAARELGALLDPTS